MQFTSYNGDEIITIRHIKSDIKEIKQANKKLHVIIVILICLALWYIYIDNEIRTMLAKATRSLAGELMCMKNNTQIVKHSNESN
jgi:hypothetical protein